jgi:hypothetical protein
MTNKRQIQILIISVAAFGIALLGVQTSWGLAPIEQIGDLQIHSTSGTTDHPFQIEIGKEAGTVSSAVMLWDITDPDFTGMSQSRLTIKTLGQPPHSTDGSFTVHQMIRSWDQSTDFGNSLTAGVDYNAHPHGVVGWNSIADQPNGREDTTHLTELVQHWIDNPGSDYGLALIPEGQQNANYPDLDLGNPPVYDAFSTFANRKRVPGTLDTDDQRITTSGGSGVVFGSIEAIADAHIHQSIPNAQNKNTASLGTGVAANGDVSMALYRYGLGEITQTAATSPWAATTAEFELHTVSPSLGNADVTFNIHRMLSGWTESGVTWNQFGAGGPVAGTDYEATALGLITIGSGPGSSDSGTLDITSTVNGWLADASSNWGLIVIPDGGTAPGLEQFLTATERLNGGLDVDDTRLNFTGAFIIPEPGTLALLGIGLLGLHALRRRE